MLSKKAGNECHYRCLHRDRYGRRLNQRGPPSFEKLDGVTSKAHIYLVGTTRQDVNGLSVPWLGHPQFAGVPLVQPPRDALTKALQLKGFI
jgi:hypothetical protein